MSNEELREQAKRTAPQIKIAAGIWIMGMMIIAVITVMWVVLAVWSNDYYSSSKAVRDAAGAGSGLLSDLSDINVAKAWVLPFEVLGISTFLFGFGFAFANILRNISLQADTLAATLPLLKERRSNR